MQDDGLTERSRRGARWAGRRGPGWRLLLALAAPPVLAGQAALAQADGPDQLTEVYRAWTVACGGGGAAAAGGAAATTRTCLMQQVVSDASNRQLLKVVVARGASGEFEATLVTPFGIDLARGVSVRIDANEPFTVPFKTCLQVGCLATLPLAGARRAALEGGRELKVSLGTADNAAATLDLTASLAGMTAALKRLEALTAR